LINNAKLNINTFGITKYKNKYWNIRMESGDGRWETEYRSWKTEVRRLKLEAKSMYFGFCCLDFGIWNFDKPKIHPLSL
jgi:hypothetical protein